MYNCVVEVSTMFSTSSSSSTSLAFLNTLDVIGRRRRPIFDALAELPRWQTGYSNRPNDGAKEIFFRTLYFLYMNIYISKEYIWLVCVCVCGIDSACPTRIYHQESEKRLAWPTFSSELKRRERARSASASFVSLCHWAHPVPPLLLHAVVRYIICNSMCVFLWLCALSFCEGNKRA